MSHTLHARIPFPEQEEGLDIVFPRSHNQNLYAAFEKVKDGETKRIESPTGITIVVEPIEGFPDAHERVNAALRLMGTIKVTRRGAELLLANFELNENNRKMFGGQTMGDVVAELEKGGPAVATAEAPATQKPGETIVGMNTGDTKPILKPGAKVAPRGLSAEDKAKLRPQAPTSQSAAEEMLQRLKNRR